MQKQGSIMRQIIILMIILFSGTMVALPDLTYHDLDWDKVNKKRFKQPYKPRSIISTNLHMKNGVRPEVINVPVDTKIYDIRIVAYSQWFADMYGYPNDYVSEMPEGMQLIQFEMVTLGARTGTYLHILLDNDLGLDIPTKNYINMVKESIRLPISIKSKLWDGLSESEKERRYKFLDEIREKKSNQTYFNMNTRIATLDYIEGKRGASTGTGILVYRNDYYMDMDYLKMFVSSQQIKFLKRENIAIWIEKKNDEPVKFKFPNAFRLQMIELLEQLNEINTYHLINDGYKKQIDKALGDK